MKTKLILFGLVVFLYTACEQKTKEVSISPQAQYIQDHPNLPIEIRKSILNGSVSIGMKESEVIASWGLPNKKEVFTSEYGSFTRWLYKKHGVYLYMKKGKIDKMHQLN